MINYKCTAPENKACISSSSVNWLEPDLGNVVNTNPKTWSDMIYGDVQEYICGFRLKAG